MATKKCRVIKKIPTSMRGEKMMPKLKELRKLLEQSRVIVAPGN